MKEIINIESISENQKSLEDLIKIPLSSLNKSEKTYNQKTLEICHTGKFLMLLNNSLIIEQVNEHPDFIIKNNMNERFGLEHEIMVDSSSKKTEGTLDDLVKSSEKTFKQKHPEKKILANIFVNPSFVFSKKDKSVIITRLVKMIEDYVFKDLFVENELVRRISWMEHSCLHFSCNLGAWWQKSLLKDHLLYSIRRKENNIDRYISTTGLDKQWLLIVIGSLGESSYEVDPKVDYNLELTSRFDKIFLMEDFRAKIYEIK